MAETKPDRAAQNAARQIESRLFLDGQRLDAELMPSSASLAEIISRHYAPLVEAAERVAYGCSVGVWFHDQVALRAALDAVRGKK